jgi:hypothetical protein
MLGSGSVVMSKLRSSNQVLHPNAQVYSQVLNQVDFQVWVQVQQQTKLLVWDQIDRQILWEIIAGTAQG